MGVREEGGESPEESPCSLSPGTDRAAKRQLPRADPVSEAGALPTMWPTGQGSWGLSSSLPAITVLTHFSTVPSANKQGYCVSTTIRSKSDLQDLAEASAYGAGVGEHVRTHGSSLGLLTLTRVTAAPRSPIPWPAFLGGSTCPGSATFCTGESLPALRSQAIRVLGS